MLHLAVHEMVKSYLLRLPTPGAPSYTPSLAPSRLPSRLLAPTKARISHSHSTTTIFTQPTPPRRPFNMFSSTVAANFSEVLDTKSFTFLIGKDEKPIVIHAGAIAGLSEPLDRLINGSMSEAQEGIAKFPDLDPESFKCIAEFAYTASYAPLSPAQFAEPIQNEDETTDTLPPSTFFELHCCPPKFDPEAIEEMWDRSRRDSIAIDAVQHFQLVTHTLYDVELFDRPHQAFRLNTSWREDLTPVLLGHARIYAFANQYLANKLKKTAFTKLAQMLAQIWLYGSTLQSVMELVRYAYNNDCIADRHGDWIDPLRRLVVSFVMMHYRLFKNFEGHRQLMLEDCEYAHDIAEHMGKWFFPKVKSRLSKNCVAEWA
ncbi:hypothetical protein DM02DRAFT_426875 [Periconia macrospinosa]|uniref:BTB domain-containing protein n=1 Tax=Periconia macrospinosa TaxID=97972 RepID=A0A2V1E926_9PLEO|nr:hypothetical protein DM02DRAFT_426875 [Periconia macrospinosa]